MRYDAITTFQPSPLRVMDSTQPTIESKGEKMSEKVDKQIEDLRKSEEEARRRHFAFIEPLGGWHESRPMLDEKLSKLSKLRVEMLSESSSLPEITESETPLRDGTVKE